MKPTWKSAKECLLWIGLTQALKIQMHAKLNHQKMMYATQMEHVRNPAAKQLTNAQQFGGRDGNGLSASGLSAATLPRARAPLHYRSPYQNKRNPLSLKQTVLERL